MLFVRRAIMAEYNLQQLNEMYVDVLREIGNIGAGNATTAVSQMLNTKIEMNVPIVKLLPVEEIGSVMGDEEQTIVGIFLGVEGDINGSMMFLMDMTSAHQMVNRLMMRDPDYAGDFDEMDQSAIREIGNIIASSYLSALSGLTGLYISPTVPFLAVDMAAAILSVPAVQFGMMGDQALLIETEFGDDKKLSGYYILMPEEDSYEKILTSLGISL
jgi:chemotaxis protein CheC